MTQATARADGPLDAYWQAAARGSLVLPRCTVCHRWQWPPRVRCMSCGGDMDWHVASGTGRVASWSRVNRAPRADLRRDVPDVVAFIDLEEGVRLFANIVDVPAGAALRIGARVRCRFAPSADGDGVVPVFVIAEGD